VKPIVRAEGIGVVFGGLAVLDGMTFEVVSGETVALLGPSGCGKTTVLRVLAGVLAPDRGRVEVTTRRVGYLPQGGVLLPWKTVLENVTLPLILRRRRREEWRGRVSAELERFGLEGFADAYPYQLSGGMRQRAALLRTVLTGAPVLLLDEPLGALDSITRRRLQGWLADLIADLSSTLVFVTHDVEEALILSSRVILLAERPARIRHDFVFSFEDRGADRRVHPAFQEARERLVAMIEEGETDDEETGAVRAVR